MYPSNPSHIHQAKILIAMLDWGLGHTTRCIPIIRQLQEQQCCITIAVNMAQKSILKSELNDIEYLELDGYDIRYSKSGKFFLWNLFLQLPKFLRAIREEHRWIQKIQTIHHFDAVISDNRYGFYLPEVPSVLITHQLSPISGKGILFDILVRFIHFRMIRQFQECWIPDNPGIPNLAGRLSHPKKLPKNAFYIGPQSRFEHTKIPNEKLKLPEQSILPQAADSSNTGNKTKIPGDVTILAILSGPEPQRTMLENIVLEQMKKVEVTCILVRGLPRGNSAPEHSRNIQIFQHLDSESMFTYMQQATLIICRSGYSSIMDLVCIQKKALLIPTPGQTEQEYLAEALQQQGIYPYMTQEHFSISSAMEIMRNFPFKTLTLQDDPYNKVISNFIASINMRNN